MSPLDALEVSVFIWDLWTLQILSWDQPLLPCSQLSWNPSSQKGAGITLQRWSGAVLQDLYTWRWDRAPQGRTHIPTSPYPCLQPHTAAWDHSPSWEREQFIAQPAFSILLHPIIWTEQADSRFYCQSSASFWAGPFPPGGISLSLYKNPNNTPQSFQQTSKAPLFFSIFPKEPLWSCFQRMKTIRGVASAKRGEHSMKSYILEHFHADHKILCRLKPHFGTSWG